LSLKAGGNRRTINSVPAAFKRLFCLLVSLSIVNLALRLHSNRPTPNYR